MVTKRYRFSISIHSPLEAIERSLYQKSLEPSVWKCLFPAKLFEVVRFVPGLYYEDLEIFYRLIEASDAPVVETNLPLYFYRYNPKSFINTWSERRLDVLKVTADLVARYNSAASRSRRLSAAYNMYLLSVRHDRRDVAVRCLRIIKESRRECLTDRRVRLSNKIASLISYMGLLPPLARIFARF